MADNDDNKVILTLREAEEYDGDGFFFCPSEVRDPPPTFRSLGCPLVRLAGRQVVSVSTSLGTYGMGSYGAFGLGLGLMPDLAACPTYQAKVGAVAKYIEGCADREREMMEYLAPAEEQPEETSNADDDDDDDDEDDDDGGGGGGGGDGDGDDGDRADKQPNTEEQMKQERKKIEEEQSKAEDEERDEEGEEEEEKKEEEEEVDPSTVRDEAKWQESAWEHEWFALLACRAEDYLQLQGKPYGKTGCSHFLFLEAVITDAQLTDRTCRFEMKRWRLEDHYTPIYEAMVKRDMVAPGSYAPEPGTNGPHPLYALVIDFLRQRPELLLGTTEASAAEAGADDGGGDVVVAKPRLPESVLHDLMAKPLGCVTRVLEVRPNVKTAL
ncbi:uncharacterized protein ACA1_319100 [Acanthamoeba castellanii str. Neff]|uniref:Uncharacterized protein n=1 Tax=Acanthamoeba castellanii (strain ATCC 30010 / Neff) TaxID=1257118 RepID=L8GIM8_ACACF|nr:uncharacterized protein ACA1_319100 [Acanthamoeba castellanii str. Neff]ELR12583.1 hypothetical protein ACA1_319100 [Acanthamoeba castellanii str. Neff]